MAALVLLVLFLSSFSASTDVLWNIDCGSPHSYVDQNNVTWAGDEGLVRTGKSKTVPSSNSIEDDPVMNSLWVFTSGKRNCYFLGADKGMKVILLAYFYYGNYDGKSSPPRFDMEVDGNNWVTVETSNRSNYYYYYELVFTVKSDDNTISVCFVQTHPNEFPFISLLQVFSLPSDMYRDLDPNHAFYNQARYAFGLNQSIFDDYGRTWDPAGTVDSGYSIVPWSNTSAINTQNIPERPPPAAMDFAMTTSNNSARSMKLPLYDYLPSSPTPVYINMYFTELARLNSTQKRSFTLNIDGKLVQSAKNITTAYRNATELSVHGIIASNNSVFSLVSTNDSTLPPVISAIEVFYIRNYTQTSPGPYETPSTKSKLPIILGAGIPGLLIVLLALFRLIVVARRMRAASDDF